MDSRRAFTLIELMVAVGMMALFMTIAIPTLYRAMNEDSMRKAVSDVKEACSTARAQAILNNTVMELCIRPADRSFSVTASAAQGRGLGVASTSPFQPNPMWDRASMGMGEGLPDRVDYQWGDRMVDHPSRPAAPAGFSVRLGPSIVVRGLGINGEDWTEDPEARVRFYPNGTCDEMSIVLQSDRGELRNIWLEVVTGFSEVEVDPNKFRAR